jgi:hypothetical protein
VLSRRNFLASAVALASAPAFSQTRPNPPIWIGSRAVQLPRVIPDITYPTLTGTSIFVDVGDDLQAAINSGQLGDEIVIAAGFTSTEEYSLPNKTGTGTLVIRSANSHLLPEGVRVTIADAVNMPTLYARTESWMAVFRADTDAHHYRFVGLEIASNPNSYVNSLQYFNWDNHHITWDRCYMHGNDLIGCRRSGAYSGNNIAVIHSHIDNFWENGSDAQAIWFHEGHTYLIHDNFLEGGGENILTGGATHQPGRLPEDITITKNTFSKRLTWFTGEPEWDGLRRTIKNHLELKSGRRVLIHANDFFQHWDDLESQPQCVLLKSSDASGLNTDAQVEHVTLRYNYFEGMHAGIAFTAHESGGNPQQIVLPCENILIEDNLHIDINLTRLWRGDGLAGSPKIWQGGGNYTADDSGRQPDNITIQHNTAIGSNEYGGGTPYSDAIVTNFTFANNIYTQGLYGLSASGLTPNHLNVMALMFPGGVFEGNCMVSTEPWNQPDKYPPGNTVPQTIEEIGFVNYIEAGGGDYRLANSSIYKGTGNDGLDPGVRFDLYNAARA